MPIVPYKHRKPLCIAQKYVCGNLHRVVFEAYGLNADREREWCDYRWFDTMSEAVLWAMVAGRPIDNWEACVATLAREEECRHAWGRWMRENDIRANEFHYSSE